MSEPVVGIVCEGRTDTPVLMAVLDAVIGDYEPRFIQPDGDAIGPAGWSQVRIWCHQYGNELETYLKFSAIDVLIIQLDFDIASQVEARTTAELCGCIKSWLGHGASSKRLVIAVPAQAIETWLLAAHVGVTPQVEHAPSPGAQLVQRKLLKADATGNFKDRKSYEQLARKLKTDLKRVRKVLPELERFAGKLERFKSA